MKMKAGLNLLCALALTATLFPLTAVASPSEAVPEADGIPVDTIEPIEDAPAGDIEPSDVAEPAIEDEMLAGEDDLSDGDDPDGIATAADEPEQELPLGNGPANSWRYADGELLDPDSMVTQGEPGIMTAAVVDGMYTTFETFSRGNCSGAGAARGIDVSKWQGRIDWARVKASGIDFALIRCGYGDDLANQDDEYFDINVRGCLENNIPFGVYIYSYATNTGSGGQGAVSEANHVLRCLRRVGLSPSQLALPVYLDREDNSTTGANQYAVANAFCSAMQSNGYTAGVYANTSWWTQLLTDSRFDQWPRWIAQYNTSNGLDYPFRKSSDVWQFSSKGSVAGISGYADLNYTYLPAAYTVNSSEYKLVFDLASYRKYNPTLSFASESEAFRHFLSTGMAAGLRASEIFDPVYYKNAYSDLRAAYGNTWTSYYDHFRKWGAQEGRQGSSDFSIVSYYNAYPDLRAAFGTNPLSYYNHYVNYGKAEGRVATGVADVVGSVTTYGGLNYSLVYDYQYYVTNNPDVKQAFRTSFGSATVIDDAAVLGHFVKYGMKEGRRGNTTFDVVSYYNLYPDLRAAFGTDIAAYYNHYLRYGKNEGRKTSGQTALVGSGARYSGKDYSAVFDPSYYAATYSDIARVFSVRFGSVTVFDESAALNHFVKYGMKEGRRGNATFDVVSYYNANPDLRAAFGTDVVSFYDHYVTYGCKENRTISGVSVLRGTVTNLRGKDYAPVYDFAYYCNVNPDVRRAFTKDFGGTKVIDQVAVLNHFVNYGMKEGRVASASFSWKVYRQTYSDLDAAFGNDAAAYFTHYLNYGIKEGRTAAVA